MLDAPLATQKKWEGIADNEQVTLARRYDIISKGGRNMPLTYPPVQTPYHNQLHQKNIRTYLGGSREDDLVNVRRGHQSRTGVPEAGNGEAEVRVVPASLQHLAHDRCEVPVESSDSLETHQSRQDNELKKNGTQRLWPASNASFGSSSYIVYTGNAAILYWFHE